MGTLPDVDPEHLKSLPIFPLSGVVFFPNTLLPLHIFEPRYRAMVAFCIEHGWPLAMVMIQPGYEAQHLGAPPVSEVGCVGDLIHHERLPDGRYHIILRGLSRIAIEEELDEGTPYRLVRARPLLDVALTETTEASLEDKMASIQACLTTLGYKRPDVAEPLMRLAKHIEAPSILTHVWGAALFVEVQERQALLSCPRVEERAEMVLGRLTELLVEEMDSGGTLH